MTNEELIQQAKIGQSNSYSPYSNVQVGAAVLTKDGKVFTGCNIENAAYSPTNCAERTAIFKAVSEGYRPGDFSKIAVVASWEGIAAPCGVCRQVFLEFFDNTVDIIMNDSKNNKIIVTNIDGLSPYQFGKEYL